MSFPIQVPFFMQPDPGNSSLVSTRKLKYARINEVFYPAGLRQDRHRHQSASFSFVASGRYAERVGRQDNLRTASTLVCHPAGEWHAVDFETDVRIFSISFPSETNTLALALADGLDRGASHRNDLVAWLGSRLACEMKRSDGASGLAIDGLVSEMLAESSRGKVLSEEKRASPWLKRAIDFLHDNFQTTLSLDEIAGVAGVHSAHLSRVFRQKMGCTVGEYVRRLRFEFACQQILSTERQLCEVALEAGFSDQSHFNRIFRTQMKITPYRYRKIHRQA